MDSLVYTGGQASVLADDQIKLITDEEREAKGGDDSIVVGGISIRFDEEYGSQTDLTGQWFTKDTYFGPSDGGNVDVYFHHSYPIYSDDIARNTSKALAEHTFGIAKAEREEMGIWVETVMDMRDDYEKQVAELCKANKIGWSSGSAYHMVRLEHVDEIEDMPESRRDALLCKFWYPGRIKRWPVVEHSLTPTPAEPRNMVSEQGNDMAMRCIKSLDSGLFLLDNDKMESKKYFLGSGKVEPKAKPDVKADATPEETPDAKSEGTKEGIESPENGITINLSFPPDVAKEIGEVVRDVLKDEFKTFSDQLDSTSAKADAEPKADAVEPDQTPPSKSTDEDDSTVDLLKSLKDALTDSSEQDNG